MRDLAGKSFLKGDFIIVHGDVVSNYPLDSALRLHRERRKKDKTSYMTMLLREAGTNHRTKAHDISPVFVIDPTRNRCMHYEQMASGESHRIKLNPEILKECDEIEIRQDLIDCGIDICSPEVLDQWSENFDWQAPRRDFVQKSLLDEIISMNKIHTHIITDHYAARVRNLRSYDAVCRDILGRWAYPICADNNLAQNQAYRLYRGNCYREDGVSLASTAEIEDKSMAGRGSTIGEGARITNSVIGRNCKIGQNVQIKDSHVWDNVTIKDGTTVQHAIIAQSVVIGEHCKVNEGALLGFEVQIAENTTIPARLRIAKGGEDKAVGRGGLGHLVEDSDDSDDEHDREALGSLGSPGFYRQLQHTHSSDSVSTIHSTLSAEGVEAIGERSRTASFGSVTSEDSGNRMNLDFHHAAVTDILEGLQRGTDPATMRLELTSLRMAENSSEHQVQRAVVVALMKRLAGLIEGSGDIKAAVSQAITPEICKELIAPRFDPNANQEADQVEFLLLMQGDLCQRNKSVTLMPFICNALYMNDTIESEGFEQWWNDERSSTGEEMVKIRVAMKPFMDAIEDDEEESSEEESDDE